MAFPRLPEQQPDQLFTPAALHRQVEVFLTNIVICNIYVKRLFLIFVDHWDLQEVKHV
jgi:hypothetical protein